MYSNVDGFNNKLDELISVNKTECYDVICITETMPKRQEDSNINTSEWKISGYDLFISPRDIFTGRGCLIYTKEE